MGQIAVADAAIYRQVQRVALEELKSLDRSKRDEYRERLLVLGGLYIKGYEIDWRMLHQGELSRRVSLPTYAFAQERYWAVTPQSLVTSTAGLQDGRPVGGIALECSSAYESRSVLALVTETEYLSLQPVWQPQPLASLETMPRDGKVLFFDGDDQLAKEFATRFPTLAVVRATPGTQYQVANDLVILRTDCEEDYARLLESVAPTIIVCRPGRVDAPVQERLRSGIEVIHVLTRSLVRKSPKSEIRLFLLLAPDAPPDITALSAFLQTVSEESPKIRVCTILAENLAPIISQEICAAHSAREVRYRDGQREIKIITEAPLPNLVDQNWFRPQGVYFITGGAGGLGGIFSEYLARKYQARLVWMGRSELIASRRAKFEALREQGADVLYVRGDVQLPADVKEAVQQAKERFGRIHGVIHAAGVVRNSFLFNKSIESLRQVLSAKVFGTLNLDEALAFEPLDAFLLCSSVASILPEAGQSDYAFANRFLDEFAGHREELRRQGLRSGRTMAINWQMWREAGIVANASAEELRVQAEQTVQLTGLPPLTSEQGIHLLEQSAQMSISSGLLGYGNRKRLLRRVEQMSSAALN